MINSSRVFIAEKTLNTIWQA